MKEGVQEGNAALDHDMLRQYVHSGVVTGSAAGCGREHTLKLVYVL